jgi:dTDP-4-dehydrorhamnose 3,5-epimerase
MMIDGLVVTPLKRINNDKGDIYHALKCSEKSFSQFGEAYFSIVHQNDVKGWKKHSKMILNLIVPVGIIKFVLFDDRESSPTYKKKFEITISNSNYCRLTVPPNIWLSFQGIGHALNLLLNIASIEHDPTESENCPLSDIQYEWSRI